MLIASHGASMPQQFAAIRSFKGPLQTHSRPEPAGAVDVGGIWYVAAAKNQSHSAPLSRRLPYPQRRTKPNHAAARITSRYHRYSSSKPRTGSAESRPTSTKRPRIALVLEGGGALGFAHIGVIDYLEQHDIPVDLVVGTSMGGLVGGLYASGRSPDEIRTLLHDIDWDVAIGGRTPFRDLSYRRKQDREDFPNRLDFGLKHGLSFPEGLNSGQEVGLILDRATLPDYALTSFNDLPIPFRCVATNMNTGRAFVFDHGSLGQAMRATMSIPGVFVPVVIDGQTFTDGGSVDNLPVDVARADGADIVNASYLETGHTTTQRAGSFLSITCNTISIMIATNELHSLENADVLIRSDLKGFTSSMFSDSAVIASKGMEAARQKAALLERFSIPDAEWAEYVKQRDSRCKTTVPNPQFLAVTGADPNTNAEIDRRLKPEVVDKPIDPKFLDLEMTRFVGNGPSTPPATPSFSATEFPASPSPPIPNPTAHPSSTSASTSTAPTPRTSSSAWPAASPSSTLAVNPSPRRAASSTLPAPTSPARASTSTTKAPAPPNIKSIKTASASTLATPGPAAPNCASARTSTGTPSTNASTSITSQSRPSSKASPPSASPL
jgi:predicted acylesterase/phospholipase RssA